MLLALAAFFRERLACLASSSTIQSADSVLPLAYVVTTESINGSMRVLSSMALSLPSFAEWPLLFTTLRIVFNTVTH